MAAHEALHGIADGLLDLALPLDPGAHGASTPDTPS